MKAKIITAIIVAILVIATIIAAINVKKEKDTKFNITATFYPVYIATLNITERVEDVTVTNLTKENIGCIHDYTLSTKDLVTLAESDALITNGAGMENFLEKVISSYNKINIIDSSIGITLIENEEEEHEDHEDEGHHHDVNSHIFVSITNYIKQVENITEGLVKLNPDNKESYIKNSDEYINKLNLLKDEMTKTIDEINCKNIVTFHNSFDYFAREFGLNVVATIENEHGASPSAKEIADIVEVIKQNDVKAIFIEPETNTKLVDAIAKEANVKVYTLNPITSGKDSKDEYINIMKENMEVLKKALS